MILNNIPSRQAEQGGALLVALFMVFLLSIMGITTMRGSNLEQRMATNSIQAGYCIQIAESLSEMALNSHDALNQALSLRPATAGDLNPELVVATDLKIDTAIKSKVESKARVRYMGDGVSLGRSLDVTSRPAYVYESVGHAQIESAGVECRIKQGAYQDSPG